MVSLWPFRADSSAATFEKALSSLATKIERTTAKIDTSRRNSRRVKAMWTLYTTFAYIFALLILVLVIGWENWQIDEYGAVVGSPLVIFGVRYALSAYYSYRISSAEAHLQTLIKERDDTIEKLKAATKYNSIKQLVEKYGDEPDRRSSAERMPTPSSGKKRKSGGETNNNNVRRTGFKPPPTANIPVNRPPPQQPAHPEQQQLMPRHPNQPLSLSSSPYPSSLSSSPVQLGPVTIPPPNPDLNANPQYPPFTMHSSSSFSTAANHSTHWYDRILDVLLGEDETQPKNRLALICMSCRLVNGQAPPGTRQLSDVGRWRCGGCRTWNGVESEARSLVNQIQVSVEDEDELRGSRMQGTGGDVDAHFDDGVDQEHSRASSDGNATDNDDDGDGDGEEGTRSNENTQSDTPYISKARRRVEPNLKSHPTSEPEAGTTRPTSDIGATSTGHSESPDRSGTPSVRAKRNVRRRSKK